MVKRNFFKKILLFYMGIVILYTSVISFTICYKEFKFSQLQAHNNFQHFVEQTGSYIDYKLQTSYELLYKISTLESFIDYRYCETTNYLLITNLFNDLSFHLNGFNRSGITLSIAKLSDDIVITPDGTFSQAHYLEESGISPDEFSAFISSNGSSPAEHTYVIPSSAIQEPNKLVILHKLKGTSKAVPIYFIITLDTTMLLTNGNDIPGDFSIYTDEPIVSLSNRLGVYNTHTLDFVKSMEDTVYTYHQKENRLTHYVNSSEVVAGLKYVYTVTSVSWLSIALEILKTSLLPMLLLLLFSIWLSYRAANSTYKPIRALVRFFGDQDDAASAVPDQQPPSELDYIQSNIERIYTINRTLQNHLDQSFTRLQEDFFRKIIYGIVDEDFIKENMQSLKLESFDQPLRLFLLDCEGVEHISSVISFKNFSLMIYEIMGEYPQHTGPAFVLPLDNQKYCIIMKAQAEKPLTDLGSYIIHSLNSHLSLDVTVCLSGVYPLAGLASGLHELLMLNNHKYSFMDQRILTQETIKDRKEMTYLYPLETEACLIKYISNNDHDKGKELLAQLIDKCLDEVLLSPSNMNLLKYSLITTFRRCLNADGKSLNQFIREYPTAIDELSGIPTAQFKERCLSLYDVIFDYCNRDKFSLDSSTASRIFMFIQENFDKDISLTDIAEHFELSESYISKLMKNSLDVNFKTYVNKLKVKKAKELLNRKTYKVSDIAAMVGCNNANTFIRIFKQYEGVSPGEYMKSLK